MINTTVFETKQGIVAFELSGHAESGPYGYDLVCAGVSAVSIGAVNALLELTEIQPVIKQADDGGYLYVFIPSEYREQNKVQVILEAMIISLESIENEYGQFIQINRKQGVPKKPC